MDPFNGPCYTGLGGLAGIAGAANRIKTAADYLNEAKDALKLAAGLLVANGETTRAIWTLEALQKAIDAAE